MLARRAEKGFDLAFFQRLIEREEFNGVGACADDQENGFRGWRGRLWGYEPFFLRGALRRPLAGIEDFFDERMRESH
jgi:hypothetical protein